MKTQFKIFTLIVSGIILFTLNACVKSGEIIDENSLPNPKVFISDAGSIVSVGINNVPRKHTLDQDNKKLYYNMGIGRSGLGVKESFSVQIVADNDTINDLISSNALRGAELLPADKYEMPTNLNLESGKDNQEFILTLDLDWLAQNYDKTYALAIRIQNPTKYQLNNQKSTAILKFNYLDLITSTTFKDDFISREFTIEYATLSNNIVFEEQFPSNFYGDATFALRNDLELGYVEYSVTKIKKAIPEISSLTGFKIIFYNPGDNLGMAQVARLYYSVDNGSSFYEIVDYHLDNIFIPEVSSNSWHKLVVQDALPAGTTDFKIEIVGKPQGPNYNPLLPYIEFFHDKGTPYRYSQP